jgi:hypothetical protein
MKSLEDLLVHVCREILVEDARSVEIEGRSYAVKSTARRGLKQIDFRFSGRDLRGLEQNPDTKSRWAALARAGKKVMQFLDGGRYLAVVSDGKVHMYQKSRADTLAGPRHTRS